MKRLPLLLLVLSLLLIPLSAHAYLESRMVVQNWGLSSETGEVSLELTDSYVNYYAAASFGGVSFVQPSMIIGDHQPELWAYAFQSLPNEGYTESHNYLWANPPSGRQYHVSSGFVGNGTLHVGGAEGDVDVNLSYDYVGYLWWGGEVAGQPYMGEAHASTLIWGPQGNLIYYDGPQEQRWWEGPGEDYVPLAGQFSQTLMLAPGDYTFGFYVGSMAMAGEEVVPLPGSIALLAPALGVIPFFRRRKSRGKR